MMKMSKKTINFNDQQKRIIKEIDETIFKAEGIFDRILQLREQTTNLSMDVTLVYKQVQEITNSEYKITEQVQSCPIYARCEKMMEQMKNDLSQIAENLKNI